MAQFGQHWILWPSWPHDCTTVLFIPQHCDSCSLLAWNLGVCAESKQLSWLRGSLGRRWCCTGCWYEPLSIWCSVCLLCHVSEQSQWSTQLSASQSSHSIIADRHSVAWSPHCWNHMSHSCHSCENATVCRIHATLPLCCRKNTTPNTVDKTAALRYNTHILNKQGNTNERRKIVYSSWHQHPQRCTHTSLCQFNEPCGGAAC